MLARPHTETDPTPKPSLHAPLPPHPSVPAADSGSTHGAAMQLSWAAVALQGAHALVAGAGAQC
eukprot:1142704-Pelagomonas_calceolata.AAC.2